MSSLSMNIIIDVTLTHFILTGCRCGMLEQNSGTDLNGKHTVKVFFDVVMKRWKILFMKAQNKSLE